MMSVRLPGSSQRTSAAVFFTITVHAAGDDHTRHPDIVPHTGEAERFLEVTRAEGWLWCDAWEGLGCSGGDQLGVNLQADVL